MLLNINLSKLLVDALPSRLRQPKLVDWIECLLKPIKVLYQDFSEYVIWGRVNLAYNSQTIVFEGGLNDVFDPFLRRIYIINNPAAPPLAYEFTRSEGEPDWMEYSRSDGQPDEKEYNTFEYYYPVGFRVVVPASLSDTDKALRTFIEKIKFSHIRYEIKYI